MGRNGDPKFSVKLYVANSGDGTVSVIDVSENEVTKTIQVGSKPIAIAVSSEWKSVYVANFLSKSISVIDTDSDVVKTTITLPGNPVHLVAGSDSMAYVIVDRDTTNFGDEYIAEIKQYANVFVDSLYIGSTCNQLKYLAYARSGFLYGAGSIYNTCFIGGGGNDSPLIVNTKTY